MLAVSQEELQGEVGSRETAEREKLQTAQEEALAREGLERLRQLKARLEAALRENVEAHSQLKAIQLKHRSAQELADATDARQKEALSRLASIDICSAEADLERWQQRLQAVSESINKLRSTLQDLEESTKGASQVGLSLQEELQRVFLGTERLRQEREEAALGANEASGRLRAAEPALEAARRRARELEGKLEDDSQSEVARCKQHKESFLLEVRQQREKMRGLRKRHTVLSEKVQGLEKRLLRSPLLPGNVAFRRKAGPGPSPSRPREKEPEAETDGARQAPVQAPAPSEAESLDYLRQWVELEEARLVARTPPKPSVLFSCLGSTQRGCSTPRGSCAL
ncbi:unnamed protein product [Effrenium voratum]|nr:unnamed protein product [Effrenium voratum]